MRLWIIKLLIRLLERPVSYRDIDDKKVLFWLDRQAGDINFHEYFRKRDLQLLKALGSGLEPKEYLITFGQRQELLTLLQRVTEANQHQEKQRLQLQREVEARAKQSNSPTNVPKQ